MGASQNPHQTTVVESGRRHSRGAGPRVRRCSFAIQAAGYARPLLRITSLVLRRSLPLYKVQQQRPNVNVSVRDRQHNFSARVSRTHCDAHALTQAPCVIVAFRRRHFQSRAGTVLGWRGRTKSITLFHQLLGVSSERQNSESQVRNRWWLGGEIKAYVFEATSHT